MDFTRPFPRTSLFRGRLWLRCFWGRPWELCPLGHSTRGKGPSCSKLWRLWTGSVACLRLSGDIAGRPLTYSASGGTVWRKWSPELVKGVSMRSCHERRSRYGGLHPEEWLLPAASCRESSAEECEYVDSLEKCRPCLASGNGLEEFTWGDTKTSAREMMF